jgi:hypothetical protein
MKKFKIILLSTAALALLTVIGVNIHLNKIVSSKDSDVTLKNIEALSGEFEFNGTTWNTDDTHSIGSNWCPRQHDCTGTTTSGWSFGDIITIGGSSSSTYEGEQVSCVHGDGNCWNGTSCIPK